MYSKTLPAHDDDFDHQYAMFFLICMIFFSAISGIVVLVRFLLDRQEMQLRQLKGSNQRVSRRAERSRSPGLESSSLSSLSTTRKGQKIPQQGSKTTEKTSQNNRSGKRGESRSQQRYGQNSPAGQRGTTVKRPQRTQKAAYGSPREPSSQRETPSGKRPIRR